MPGLRYYIPIRVAHYDQWLRNQDYPFCHSDTITKTVAPPNIQLAIVGNISPCVSSFATYMRTQGRDLMNGAFSTRWRQRHSATAARMSSVRVNNTPQ